jgi:hypothetical protein
VWLGAGVGFQLAQLNVGRLVAPEGSPEVAGFFDRLVEINAVAEAAPGFVWRLVDEDGQDATSLRPYDDVTLVNLSVWESVEALSAYVYRTAHLDVLRQRRQWFLPPDGPHAVLWWIPAGRWPTLDEAGDRLKRLAHDGPGPDAFTLREPYAAPGGKAATISA